MERVAGKAKSVSNRIIAGIAALVVGLVAITTAHIQAVNAADLTFIVTAELPVATGHEVVGGVHKPEFNKDNFYCEGVIPSYKYYFLGKPFSLIRTEDEGYTFLLLAQNPEWGNSAWSESGSNNADTLITATNQVATEMALESEKDIVKMINPVTGKNAGIGFNGTGMYSGKNIRFYPISASELMKLVAQSSGQTQAEWMDASTQLVAKQPGVDYWTRTLAGDNIAYYVNQEENAYVWPKTKIGNEVGGTGEATTDPNHVTQSKAIIPSFRMDISSSILLAELPATETAEAKTENSSVPQPYIPKNNGFTRKYILIDSKECALESDLNNNEITNIYSNGSVLIPYQNATTGDNRHVSTLIYNKDGKILYYGRHDDVNKANGKFKFDTPAGLQVGETYTLAIFEEYFRGQYETTLCSSPVFCKFTVQDESTRTPDTIIHTVSPEHLDNFTQDASGETTYYFGGKPFSLGKVNDDRTLLLVSKQPSDWSDKIAWDEYELGHQLELKADKILTSVERGAIKNQDVTYSKYDPGSYMSGSLILYPVTRTLFDIFSAQVKNIPAAVDEYWTASYKDSKKAYLVDQAGDYQATPREDTHYTVAATNIDLSKALAQDNGIGEDNSNLSIAAEPQKYRPNNTSGSVKLILFDDTTNRLDIADTSIEMSKNSSTEISYENSVIDDEFSGYRQTAKASHYIDAVIYKKDSDKILYFGRLKKLFTIDDKHGKVTLKLPADIEEGNYDLALIEETAYADKQTNTCSSVKGKKISLSVTKEKPGKDVHEANTQTPSGGAFAEPQTMEYTNSLKTVLNQEMKPGNEFTIDTTTNKEHKFVVYNEGTESFFALMGDLEGQSTWNNGTEGNTDGSTIINAPETDANDSGTRFTQTCEDDELRCMLPTDINTADKASGATGSATGVKLFVPSYTELSAGNEDPDEVKSDVLKKTTIGNIDNTETASIYWTRSWANNSKQSAYYISNGDYLNGVNDTKNAHFSEKYIVGANFDLSQVAFFAGDANDGRFNDVSPVPKKYSIEDVDGHAKAYFQMAGSEPKRLNLSMESIKTKEFKNAQPGASYTIPYINATTGENMYLSCIIYKVTVADGTAVPTYYGRLKRLANESDANGNVNFVLPSSDTGMVYDPTYKYMVAFFAEEANEPYKFNYVSSPVYTQFTVKEKKSLEFCDIKVDDISYSGNWVKPVVTVYDGDTGELVPEEYYTVSIHSSSICGDHDLVEGTNGEKGVRVKKAGNYYVKITATNVENNPYIEYGKKVFHVTRSIANMNVIMTPESGYKYDGQPQKPTTVTVANEDSDILVEGVDYELDYADNTEVGTATLFVKGINAYTGVLETYYEIEPGIMTVSLGDTSPIPYDGEKHTLNIRPDNDSAAEDPATQVNMMYQGKPFTGAVNAGEYEIDWQVSNPNYETVEGTATLKITPREATTANTKVIYKKTGTATKPKLPYAGGEPIIPELEVTVGGLLVDEDSIEQTWTNNINPGEATGSIKFKNNFTGEKGGLKCTIVPLDLTAALEDITIDQMYYTGSPQIPVIRLNGTDISKSGSFNFEYTDKKSGEKVQSMSAVGNYNVKITPKDTDTTTGSASKDFSILPVEMTEENTIVNLKSEVNYTGEPITDAIQSIAALNKDGQVTLDPETDYTIAYSNNTEAGEASASITFKGNFHSEAPIVKTFTIKPGVITTGTVTTLNVNYDGEQHIPTINVNSPSDTTIKYAVKTITEGVERGVRPADSEFAKAIGNSELIDAGDYEVWYEISKKSYETVCDYTGVKIATKSMEDGIKIENIDEPYDEAAHPFTTANITLTGDAAGASQTFSLSQDGEYTPNIPTFEDSGAFTQPGTYEIWCKFTKPNYTPVTRLATVIIRKVTIPYSLTGNGQEYPYDGQEHSVVCTSRKEGAKIEYSTDNVNFSETVPKFTEIGTYPVYIRLTLAGYDDVELTSSLKINPIEMDVKATGYSGPYDAKSHSLSFTFNNKPSSSEARLYYKEKADGAYSTVMPFKTNAGKYTIYYKIEADNYRTIENWVEIDITALDTAAESYGYDGPWDGAWHSPSVIVSVPQTNYTVKYSEDDGNNWSELVPRYKEPGTYNVKWLVEENDGNYKPLEGDVVIRIGARIDEQIDDSKIDKDKDINDSIKDIVDNTRSTTATINDNIGSGITGEAFKNADGIRNIVVEENNPNYSSKDGCLYDKTGDTLIAVPNAKNLDSDTVKSILSGVTEIGTSAFENCKNLSGTVKIPDSVEVIGENAFKGTNLSRVEIPVGVEKIESGAFANTKSLKNVLIEGDPEIEEGAFTGSGISAPIYANDGKTLVYVPKSTQVSDGTYVLDSSKIDKVAGGALTDNSNIKTVKITGDEVVTFAENSVGKNVTIKVPDSVLEETRSQNPKLASQMESYKDNLSKAKITLNTQGRVYKIAKDGTYPTPDFTVEFEGTKLKQGVDYTTKYSYDLANGTITITGKGSYEGTGTKTFPFSKTGELIVDTTTTMKGNEFKNGSSASGLYTDKGELAETLSSAVDKETKEEAEIKNIVIRMEYDGAVSSTDRGKMDKLVANSSEFDGIAKIFNINVYTEDEDGNQKEVPTLNSPVKFSVEIPDNYAKKGSFGIGRVHDSQASVISSTANTTSVEFESDRFSAYALLYSEGAIDESKFTATMANTSYTYTGSAVTPAVTVQYDGSNLSNGTDYTVTYSNNTNVGTATATVTGQGTYSGITRTLNFTISEGGSSGGNGSNGSGNSGSGGTKTGNNNTPTYDITKVTTVLAGTSEYTYSGTEIKPPVNVIDNGVVLKQGSDYELYYQSNTDAGTAKIIVSGINNYTGYRSELSFTINPKSIASADVKVSGIKDEKEYTGENVTQSPTVKYNDKNLSKGTDYRLSYSDNKKVGTATMTITGINNFTGSVDYEFNIIESDKSKEEAEAKEKKENKDAESKAVADLAKDGKVPVDVSGSMELSNGTVKNKAPNTGDASAAKASSPKTGDTTTMPVALGLILVLLGGGCIYFIKRKKPVNKQ